MIAGKGRMLGGMCTEPSAGERRLWLAFVKGQV
jgi:hypothetical protein